MNPVSIGLLALFVTVLILLTRNPKSGLSQRLRPRAQLEVITKSHRVFKEIDVLMEVPDFASLIGFALAAGESLESSLRIAVQRSSGLLGQVFAEVIQSVDHGAILQIELEQLGLTSPSEQVRELAAKLSLASANGSAVTELVEEYVQSAVLQLKATLLERAGKNETKMMIPVVFIILPITVMFAIFPSLTILQSTFL